MEPYRWTLAEYVLRCEQGSDLREIVVEAEADRDLLADALTRWGTEPVTVLDGDYIQVEPGEVDDAGFSSGIKGRLLAIAAALQGAKDESRLRAQVVVVVDRNYDAAPPIADTLLLTDGYSIESYTFSRATLNRFAGLVLGRATLPLGARGRSVSRRQTFSGDDLYRRVEGAAVQISAVRLTLRALSDPPRVFESWPDYVSVSSDGLLTTDDAGLLHNVLEHAGRADEEVGATERLGKEALRVSADKFRLVRGHDFVRLLLKLLRSPWGRRIAGTSFARASEGELTRLLLVSVDPAYLDSCPLFAELRRRFA